MYEQQTNHKKNVSACITFIRILSRSFVKIGLNRIKNKWKHPKSNETKFRSVNTCKGGHVKKQKINTFFWNQIKKEQKMQRIS